MSPFSSNKRRVLVVGGSSGIGSAIARAFVAEGSVVTLTGATAAEAANATKDPALAAARVEPLDVRDGERVSVFVQDLGELDVVVNCAGVIRRGEEHRPEVFADVVDINLVGGMRVCAAARGGLASRRGCIVNTASMLSFFGGGLVLPTAQARAGLRS